MTSSDVVGLSLEMLKMVKSMTSEEIGTGRDNLFNDTNFFLLKSENKQSFFLFRGGTSLGSGPSSKARARKLISTKMPLKLKLTRAKLLKAQSSLFFSSGLFFPLKKTFISVKLTFKRFVAKVLALEISKISTLFFSFGIISAKKDGDFCKIVI